MATEKPTNPWNDLGKRRPSIRIKVTRGYDSPVTEIHVVGGENYTQLTMEKRPDGVWEMPE